MRLRPTTITTTGTQNALDLGSIVNAVHSWSEVMLVRCANASALTINGILAPTVIKANTFATWPMLCFVTIGSGSVVFNDESGSATAARRIRVIGGTLTLAPPPAVDGAGDSIWVGYDGIGSRWRTLARGTTFG
jgi:hypothetical protein